MGIRLYEHQSREDINLDLGQVKAKVLFRSKTSAYIVTENKIQAHYLIGLDWLIPNKRHIQIFPKINQALSEIFDSKPEDSADFEILKSDYYEIDYIQMLMSVAKDPIFDQYFDDLFYVDLESPPISVDSVEDQLTPLLIIRYLQLLKRIVHKGLKKSYYTVEANLTGKIKGKIVIGSHFKNNLYKNRLTHTTCSYQEFGINSLENRYLKYVLKFAAQYVVSNKSLFSAVFKETEQVIKFISPAFEQVTDIVNINTFKEIKHNPFFGEYKVAFKVGKLLLNKFSYSIVNSENKEKVNTSPFWINMPGLFEMYITSQVRLANPVIHNDILYQFSTYGNALDILLKHASRPLVIDAKYKLHYNTGGHFHEDIRQVAGYSRLEKVRDQLNISDDRNIDCLIIYPDMKKGISDLSLENIFGNMTPIKPYHKIWKLGVKLPLLSTKK